ncbi:MAG TPA: dihydrolipoamide acetyltransferase family protein [Acidimicrobiales bacterium]|nr:dihydrolipoamide acetyltransferase family protein [Acidimicrobiales bacterium]
MADVTLPSLGESVAEGIITRWFKAVGDRVERDEPLFEVSTDKVDSEMPSPAAGVLREIIAAEGDTVATGARVAVIDEGADVSPTTAPPPAAGTTVPASPVAPAPPATPDPPSPAPVATRPPFPEPAEVSGVVVSPVVRRILADAGVDPSAVTGSGPGGSITRRDAERAAGAGPSDTVTVPLSAGRRRMGEHLAAAARVVPHGFVAVEADASVLDDLDAVGGVTRDDVPVPDEVVVTLAAVRALGEFESLNATFEDDTLEIHRSINVGFVRAADDAMLVPVVHAAGGLTLRSLARRVHELDERLAARRLSADDLMGGTFTVAGPTGANELWAAPIIVAPQVAVLSVGAARRVPVVVGDGATPTIGVGRRVVLGLAFDHRVCSPTTAAAYLERVAQLLAGLDIGSER